MIDVLQILSSVVTAIVAVIALMFAYRQTKLAREGHIAERRPYIVPAFEIEGTDKARKKVYLSLTNFGNTPAKDVILEFQGEEPWHDISSASHFPFLAENRGISVIPPEANMRFFVGNLAPKSSLQTLRSSDLEVVIEFAVYGEKARFRDNFRITLRDFAGSKSLPRAK